MPFKSLFSKYPQFLEQFFSKHFLFLNRKREQEEREERTNKALDTIGEIFQKYNKLTLIEAPELSAEAAAEVIRALAWVATKDKKMQDPDVMFENATELVTIELVNRNAIDLKGSDVLIPFMKSARGVANENGVDFSSCALTSCVDGRDVYYCSKKDCVDKADPLEENVLRQV